VQLFKRLFEAMGAKTPMQKIYTPQVLTEAKQGLAMYPPKEFLGEQGVFAYRLIFMVTMERVPELVNAIRARFPSVQESALQEGEHRNAQGEAIHFAIRSEFNGATVEMLTNSSGLMQAIDALQLEPPPPWVAFPDADPEELGSRQGASDYWWNVFWQPFWTVQRNPDRQLYIEKYDIPSEWNLYLQLAACQVQSH